MTFLLSQPKRLDRTNRQNWHVKFRNGVISPKSAFTIFSLPRLQIPNGIPGARSARASHVPRCTSWRTTKIGTRARSTSAAATPAEEQLIELGRTVRPERRWAMLSPPGSARDR